MSERKVVSEKIKGEKHGPLILYKKWCKGCNICVKFCPKDVLRLGKDGKVLVDKEEECTSCGLCELRCPDFAILIQE